VLLSQLLFKVTVTSCSFYIKVQCVRLAAGRRTLNMCCYRSRLVFTQYAYHFLFIRCRGVHSGVKMIYAPSYRAWTCPDLVHRASAAQNDWAISDRGRIFHVPLTTRAASLM